MVRSIAFSIASALLLAGSLVAAGNPSQSGASNTTSTWTSSFKGRAFPVAKPSDSCKVCFYEEPNYGGASYCVGKRAAGCTEVAPISAPSTIGSVKFFTSADDCELVANVRVTVPPYDEQVDLITSDVPSTGYDFVVQELYVEPAGRACLLAAVDSTHFGRCYTDSATAIESTYSQQFYEVLLFKAPTSDFYVVAYEGEGFNAKQSTKQSAAGLSKRFAVSSKDMSIGSEGETLKISSIQYVPCAEA